MLRTPHLREKKHKKSVSRQLNVRAQGEKFVPGWKSIHFIHCVRRTLFFPNRLLRVRFAGAFHTLRQGLVAVPCTPASAPHSLKHTHPSIHSIRPRLFFLPLIACEHHSLVSRSRARPPRQFFRDLRPVFSQSANHVQHKHYRGAASHLS